LSTKLSPKENKNNSLNHQSSKEISYDNENNFKSCNNNNLNINSNRMEKNKSFKLYTKRETNYLVINELLNPSYDKYASFNKSKYINSPKSKLKSEKNNLLLKLTPVKLKSNLKISNIMNSPIGNIKYKIRSIEHKSFLNKSNANNNDSLIANVSNNISNNMSDINILLNKTNNKEDQNISSFDLNGNINNLSNSQRKNNIKNNNIYPSLKSSFKKLNKIKKPYGIPKLNKHLFLPINKSLFEDKKNTKNKPSPNLFITKNSNKSKLTKLILSKKDSSDKELKNNKINEIINIENEKKDTNIKENSNSVQKQNSKEKKKYYFRKFKFGK
jgi:hypothetical protein